MHILHVGFAVEPNPEKIKEIFDGAESWLKYASTCWLLKTDLSAAAWTARLEKVIEKDKRHFLICRLDMTDSHGWLQRNAWDWIKEHTAAV